MNKTLIIIRREFETRIRKRSFILLTVLMPFIFAALVFVPMWLSSIQDDEQKAVAVYDRTGHYSPVLKSDAAYRFVPVANPDAPALYADTSSFEAVVAIRGSLTEDPANVTVYSNKTVPNALLTYVETALNEQVRNDKLAATGITNIKRIIDDVQTDLTIPTVKRTAEGTDSHSSTAVAMACGFLFTFLIYIFVFSYGAMVMQSVLEEKTNRIVELMVSSVKPFQLMMGKIVGISMVGLLQMAIWAVLLAVILTGAGFVFGLSAPETSQLAAAGQASMAADGADALTTAAQAGGSEAAELYAALINLPYVELGVMFLFYFVGGYLLYASLFAAIGASVNESEDTSQFMMPMTIVLIFGLYAAMASVDNTSGPLAFWTSLIPFTSPIVMMVRIPFGVPLWQELLSLALLYLTALGCVWTGARIYRVGILMYGKKPTVKEMLKWMRYK